MSLIASCPDSETGAKPRANVPSISTHASASGYANPPTPLGVLPVRAALTNEHVDSLKRQASRWKGMDPLVQDEVYREVDHLARAWRESEYDKLAVWPTVQELARLLDHMAIALNLALPSAETLSVYIKELSAVPLPLLDAGLTRLLRGYKWQRFPPLAEILSAVDEAGEPLLRDLRVAHAYCWKVEMHMLDKLPLTQRQREGERYRRWRATAERSLSAVAGPFAPPSRESRTPSR